MKSLFKFLVWLDVWILHVVTLGCSKPGETISAAAWSLYRDGKWQGKLLVPLINALFYVAEKDHCRKAWLWQKHLYD